MITEIGRFLLILGLIYLGITAVLIITNRPTKITGDEMDFEALTAVSYQPERRGDVNSVGQLEDDLADLIAVVK